jgi:DNA-binding transcriptional LysR family regulator
MAIFVKVVETGRFSEAAQQLGSSPSAVSRSIYLFEQTKKAHRLNRAGLLQH